MAVLSYERILNSLDYRYQENIIMASSGDYELIEIRGYPDCSAFYKRRLKSLIETYNPVLSLKKRILLCTPLKFSAVRPLRYYYDEPVSLSEHQFEIPFVRRDGLLDLFSDDRFFQKIPDTLRNIIGRFENSNWKLLNYAIRNPEFIELVESNPAVAFLAANIDLFKSRLSYDSFDSKYLLKLKQTKILELAGFPPRERLRKAFLRIPPSEISINGILMMRKCINKDSGEKRRVKLISHIPELNDEILLFLHDDSYFNSVKDSFLIELSNIEVREKRIDIIRRFKKTCTLYARLAQRFPPVKEIKQIEILYKRIIKNFNLGRKGDILDTTFRNSPFPDAYFIKYLATPSDMLVWGGYSRNCLKSLIRNALSGKYLYYKIKLGSETATLQVNKTVSGYRLALLRGRFNRECSENLKASVNLWFESRGKIDSNLQNK